MTNSLEPFSGTDPFAVSLPFRRLLSALRRLVSGFQGLLAPPTVKRKCLEDGAGPPAGYRHVAFEVPLGSAQIKYFARCDQWVPRGGVLRCLIQHDKHDQLVVKIDDQELRLKQFARLLTTYAGWGMRIEFVPEDEMHRRPVREAREPEPEE